MDCRSHNSSPVRRRAQQRLNRVRGALNRSCSVPDSNNPPCFSPPSHGDISIPVSDLTEIGADEHLSCKSVWSNRLQRFSRGKSCETYPHCNSEDSWEMSRETEDAAETEHTNIQECHESQCEECAQDFVQDFVQEVQDSSSCTSLNMEQDSSEDQTSLNHSLYIPNNYMTKSMLFLNEESQDEVSHCQTAFKFMALCSHHVFSCRETTEVSGEGWSGLNFFVSSQKSFELAVLEE